MRASLVRGATAGTLAALLVAMVWIMTAPTERRASTSAISAADRHLAESGITVVRPPTVDESILDHPSRALIIAGVSLAIGVVAGAALSAFDRGSATRGSANRGSVNRGSANWPVWLALMAVPTLGLSLFITPAWRGVACWGALWVPLGVSSWWSDRSATA